MGEGCPGRGQPRGLYKEQHCWIILTGLDKNVQFILYTVKAAQGGADHVAYTRDNTRE